MDASLSSQTLWSASLYSRQILAAGLAGVCGLRKEVEELTERMGPSPEGIAWAAAMDIPPGKGPSPGKWEEVRLTRYEAARSLYDTTLRAVPIDYSKGKFTVRVVPMLSDEAFAEVVALCRSH